MSTVTFSYRDMDEIFSSRPDWRAKIPAEDSGMCDISARRTEFDTYGLTHLIRRPRVGEAAASAPRRDISGLSFRSPQLIMFNQLRRSGLFLAATRSLPRCHPEQTLHGGLELSRCAAVQSHKGAVRWLGHECQPKLGHRWSKNVCCYFGNLHLLDAEKGTNIYILFFLLECTSEATPVAF